MDGVCGGRAAQGSDDFLSFVFGLIGAFIIVMFLHFCLFAPDGQTLGEYYSRAGRRNNRKERARRGRRINSRAIVDAERGHPVWNLFFGDDAQANNRKGPAKKQHRRVRSKAIASKKQSVPDLAATVAQLHARNAELEDDYMHLDHVKFWCDLADKREEELATAEARIEELEAENSELIEAAERQELEHVDMLNVEIIRLQAQVARLEEDTQVLDWKNTCLQSEMDGSLEYWFENAEGYRQCILALSRENSELRFGVLRSSHPAIEAGSSIPRDENLSPVSSDPRPAIKPPQSIQHQKRMARS